MQLLTGLDEMFLSYDTSKTFGHVGGIAVFDGDDEHADDRLGFVRRRVAERLSTLPPLRWRLVQVDLDRYWVESEVDLAHHVVAVKLPPPGDEAIFKDLLVELMSGKLDRSRPMWRLYVIEGLADGQYAYMLKITHGLVDGTALMMIYDLLSDEPVATPVESPAAVLTPQQIQNTGRKIIQERQAKATRVQLELAEWVAQRVKEEQHTAFPAMMARAIPGEMGAPLVDLVNATKPSDVPEVAPTMPTIFPPDSPFNGNVTPNVGICLADLSLDDVRAVGKLIDGSINDALLGITAGALRRYMVAGATLPDRPLLASTPISWRTGEEDEPWSNQVWMLFLNLPTHLPDPLDRLRQAHRSSSTAKANWERMPGHLLRDMSSVMPAAMIGPMSEMMAHMPAQMLPKVYNVSVSNVRGPVTRPSYGGAPMRRYFAFGFLPPTCGLLVAATSLVDRITVSYTGCRDIVTDLDTLAEYTHESLADLLTYTDA